MVNKIAFRAATANPVEGVSSLHQWQTTQMQTPSPAWPRRLRALTEERGQPVDVDLTVGVEERQDLASGHGRPQESGPDQPFPFPGADDPHFGKPSHVLFQLLLQVFWERRRQTQKDTEH